MAYSYSPRAFRPQVCQIAPPCNRATLAHVYFERREEILKRRKEQKQARLDRWFQYNLGQASNPPRGELGSEV